MNKLRAFFLLLASLLLLGCHPASAAFKVPQNQGYVTDLANVLSPETKAKITEIAKELDQKTTSQIAILTIPTLDDTPIEEASLQTARTWGVGSKKAGNTGLLMLFAINDHKLRTEVGYGLEGILTDGMTGEVRDQIFVPAFRRQDFDTGILQGTAYYAQKIAEAHQVTLNALSSNDVALVQAQPEQIPHQARRGLGFGVFIFIIIIILLGMRGGGGFLLPLLLLGSMGGGGGYNGGGFGGGGSDDNDFGGFGGGGFGGGGSSGGW